MDYTACSNADANDLVGVSIEERPIEQEIPYRLSRNVGWSFLCLDNDPQTNLKEYFVSPENLLLKHDYCFPEPPMESFTYQLS